MSVLYDGSLALSAVFVLGAFGTGGLPEKTAALGKRIGQMTPAMAGYFGMGAFGAAIAFRSAPRTRGNFVAAGIGVATILALIASLWLVNDLFDKETDKHANDHRPTVDGTLTDRDIEVAAGLLLVTAFGMAFAVGTVAYVVAWIAINLAYSMPPVRLKSNAYTAKLSEGLLAAVGLLMTYDAVAATLDRSVLFTGALFTLIITVNLSYVDLKDAEHDANSNAATFVTRYGKTTVRRGLMVTIPLSYVFVGVLFGVRTLLPVFGVLGVVAAGLLRLRSEDYHRLAYELDVTNGCYLLLLAVGYYV